MHTESKRIIDAAFDNAYKALRAVIRKYAASLHGCKADQLGASPIEVLQAQRLLKKMREERKSKWSGDQPVVVMTVSFVNPAKAKGLPAKPIADPAYIRRALEACQDRIRASGGVQKSRFIVVFVSCAIPTLEEWRRLLEQAQAGLPQEVAYIFKMSAKAAAGRPGSLGPDMVAAALEALAGRRVTLEVRSLEGIDLVCGAARHLTLRVPYGDCAVAQVAQVAQTCPPQMSLLLQVSNVPDIPAGGAAIPQAWCVETSTKVFSTATVTGLTAWLGQPEAPLLKTEEVTICGVPTSEISEHRKAPATPLKDGAVPLKEFLKAGTKAGGKSGTKAGTKAGGKSGTKATGSGGKATKPAAKPSC